MCYFGLSATTTTTTNKWILCVVCNNNNDDEQMEWYDCVCCFVGLCALVFTSVWLETTATTTTTMTTTKNVFFCCCFQQQQQQQQQQRRRTNGMVWLCLHRQRNPQWYDCVVCFVGLCALVLTRVWLETTATTTTTMTTTKNVVFLLFATTTTTMNKWIDLLSFCTMNSCVIRITADLDDGCCSQK